jgi:hypothetical protein
MILANDALKLGETAHIVGYPAWYTEFVAQLPFDKRLVRKPAVAKGKLYLNLKLLMIAMFTVWAAVNASLGTGRGLKLACGGHG